MKDKPITKFAELSKNVLFSAIAACFKDSFVDGYMVTDLLPLEKRDRSGELGREEYVVRFHRDFFRDVRKPPEESAFLFIRREDAKVLIKALEKLPEEERGIDYEGDGNGTIYKRLRRTFGI